MSLTSKEYIKELVEEVITTALDFGQNPTNNRELALAEASEMLYRALDKMVTDK